MQQVDILVYVVWCGGGAGVLMVVEYQAKWAKKGRSG